VNGSQALDPWQSGVTAVSNAERVRLLFALSRSTMVANLAVAMLVAVWLWDVVAHTSMVGWLAAMGVNLIASIALYRRYQTRPAKPLDASRWERFLAIKAVYGGFVWGSLVWLLLPNGGEFQWLVVILGLCMVSLGVAAVYSPSRLVYYGFMAPVALMAAPSLLGSVPFDGFAAAGWGVLIYLATLVSVHDLLYRNLCATFQRRFESEALAMEQNVIFDSAAEAIGLFRPNYLAKCNRQWGELFGYSMEEATGQPSWAIFPSYDYWREFANNCLPTILQGKAYSAVVQLRRANDELFWAEIRGMAVNPANLELGTVWMGTDISQRLRTESELRASELRFRDLVSLSTDWYWEQDREFRYARISGVALERIGINTAWLLGKARWEIKGIVGVSTEQWQAHRKMLNAHLPFRDFIYEVQMSNKERRWFSISGNPAYGENGDFAGYHGVGTDITERVRAAEQFRHLAHHDTLTGLPNRRLLTDRLEKALALARRSGNHVAMMLLDLDDFKIINDSAGHSAGDAVLITIANRLREIIRESDTVSRLGGDEFVLLLTEMTHINDAVRVAEKIVAAVLEPVEAGGRQYVLGVSIGIAVFPDHAANVEGLMQLADIAMYEAKRNGGSRYRFAEASPATITYVSPPPQPTTRPDGNA